MSSFSSLSPPNPSRRRSPSPLSMAGRKGDVEASLLDSPDLEKHVPLRHRSNSMRKLRKGLRTCSPAVVLAYASKISRLLLRSLAYFLIGSTAVSIFYAILMPVYSSPPAHYQKLADVVKSSDLPGRANPSNLKIFIASNQNDAAAIRGHWGKNVRTLVDLLGPNNVFLSIYDNDSGPETPKALAELGDVVACNRSIVSGSHVKLADLPQIEVPSGQHGVKRTEYRAHIMNRALRPLDSPSMRPNNTEPGLVYASASFSRVMFLDNVYFDPVEAVQLLFSTRVTASGNATYEAACATSFSSWGTLDEGDVIRDTDGQGLGYPKFPWFSLAGSGKSRADVLAGRDAVRVHSCWGGLAAFDARYFQLKASRRFDEDSGAGRIDHIVNDGLIRFRSVNELFWDSSERCLLQADLSRRYQASSGRDRDVEDWGIYMNPFVRVSKSKSTFRWLSTLRRFEHVFAPMQYSLTLLWMYPLHNERRLEIPGNKADRVQWFYFSPEYLEKDRGRDGAWLDKNVLVHPGSFCGMRQMSVMGVEFRVNGQHKVGKEYTVFDPPAGWHRGWL